jgi:uncharacterized small protein (DUF1192 family)
MTSIKEITKDLSLLRDATHLSVVDLEKQICVLNEEVLKLNTRIKALETNSFIMQKYIQQSIQKDEKTIVSTHDN